MLKDTCTGVRSYTHTEMTINSIQPGSKIDSKSYKLLKNPQKYKVGIYIRTLENILTANPLQEQEMQG